MEAFIQRIQQEVHGLVVKSDEALEKFTSFKTGGKARFFVMVDNLDVLVKVVQFAWKNNVPVRVIGSGTNVIASDEGFDGLLIKNNCRRFELQGMKGKFVDRQMKVSQAYLYAEAGALTNQVVRYIVDQGFGGIETALGLPGTIGGAVTVNANFSKEDLRVGRSLYAAKILTKEGIIDVDNAYFCFGFDTSRVLSERSVLLSVLIALYPEDKKKLWERAEMAVTYRSGTQPKNVTNGMTFRNMTLTNLYPNSSLPNDVTCEFLLEKAGLLDYQVNDVALYSENPRYILNKGKGTVADVKKMQSDIKKMIFQRFGVQLDMQLHALS